MCCTFTCLPDFGAHLNSSNNYLCYLASGNHKIGVTTPLMSGIWNLASCIMTELTDQLAQLELDAETVNGNTVSICKIHLFLTIYCALKIAPLVPYLSYPKQQTNSMILQ
jgi:hypothetical protein